MSELDILIQEIARVALEDKNIAQHIGHQLDVTDEELQEAAAYLNGLLEGQE